MSREHEGNGNGHEYALPASAQSEGEAGRIKRKIAVPVSFGGEKRKLLSRPTRQVGKPHRRKKVNTESRRGTLQGGKKKAKIQFRSFNSPAWKVTSFSSYRITSRACG